MANGHCKMQIAARLGHPAAGFCRVPGPPKSKCKLQIGRIGDLARWLPPRSRVASDAAKYDVWKSCTVLTTAVFVWQSAYTISFAAPFSFDDIQFWVGSGANRAALAIDWIENAAEPAALVWGYRWDGVAHGSDILGAIVAADPRLYAKLGGTAASPNAVFGLGYDANGDGQFAIDDGTVFDSTGIALTGPADRAASIDPADFYAEGWFTGFWHYGVAATNPFQTGGHWSDTAVGMASRALSDGVWDGWTFSPTFNFESFPANPVAAAPPITAGDFNGDGRVDVSDYDLWRSSFGSTTQLETDANGNGVVDAADYVVWRKAMASASQVSTASPLSVAEPHFGVRTSFSLCALLLLRKRKEKNSWRVLFARFLWPQRC